MEINYSLNDTDMSTYYSYYIKNSVVAQKNLKKDRIKTVLLGLGVLLLFSYFFINSVALVIGLAIMYTIFTLSFFERTVDNKIKRLTKRANRNNNLNSEFNEIKLIFSEKGVQEITAQDYFIKWENIYSVDFTISHLFIFLTHNSAIILPYRSLDDHQLVDLEKLVEKYYPKQVNRLIVN